MGRRRQTRPAPRRRKRRALSHDEAAARIGRGRDADALGANALGILSVRAARSAVSIPACEERLRASKNPGRLAGVLKTWR